MMEHVIEICNIPISVILMCWNRLWSQVPTSDSLVFSLRFFDLDLPGRFTFLKFVCSKKCRPKGAFCKIEGASEMSNNR